MNQLCLRLPEKEPVFWLDSSHFQGDQTIYDILKIVMVIVAECEEKCCIYSLNRKKAKAYCALCKKWKCDQYYTKNQMVNFHDTNCDDCCTALPHQ